MNNLTAILTMIIKIHSANYITPPLWLPMNKVGQYKPCMHLPCMGA